MKKLAAACALVIASTLVASGVSTVWAYPPGTGLTVSGPASVTSGLSFTASVANAQPGCTITFTVGGVSATAVANGSGAASAALTAPSNGGTYSVGASGCGESASSAVTVTGPSISGPTVVRVKKRAKFRAYGFTGCSLRGEVGCNRLVNVYFVQGDTVIKKRVKAKRSGAVVARFKFPRRGQWGVVITKNRKAVSMVVRVA